MLVQFLSEHGLIVLLVIFCVMAILFILMACLVAGSDHSDYDDEAQMRYLSEWRKRKEGTKK